MGVYKTKINIFVLSYQFLGLPKGVESQDSEQFFKKVLGVSEGSSLGGMKPILEGNKGELTRSTLPERALLSGI